MNDIIKKDFIDIPSFLTDGASMINYATDSRCGTCLSNCETECKDWCEISCLGEGGCDSGECDSCEIGCQFVCENGCETNCETECQNCLSGGCQGSCQDSCEFGCLGCQNQQPITQLPTPTLDTSKTIKTHNSISITIIPVSNATSYEVELSINGNIISTLGGNKLVYLFTNLISNTKYTIKIKCSAIGFYDSDWNSYTATTLSKPWHWSFSTSGGSEFALTATEWIEFVNRINEVRLSRNLSEYAFTTNPSYVSEGKEFSVTLFKEASRAINDMVAVNSDCLNAQARDIISGSRHFDELENKLNSLI